MAYTPKDGEGALFRNERKTSDSHPNATGYITAHRDIRKGERVRLAAWTKDAGKGKFQSLRMSDEQRREEPQAQVPDDDPEIPF